MTDCVVITVQLLSRVPPFVTPMDYSSPGSSVLQCLPVCSHSCPFEAVMLSNHLILCLPLCLWPQSFPASGSFPMSWLFKSGGQRIGASTSASVLAMKIQGWFPLGLTGLISLLSKWLSRVFSSTSLKASDFQHSAFFIVQLSHPYMTTGKTIALTRQTFVGKMISPV